MGLFQLVTSQLIFISYAKAITAAEILEQKKIPNWIWYIMGP